MNNTPRFIHPCLSRLLGLLMPAAVCSAAPPAPGSNPATDLNQAALTNLKSYNPGELVPPDAGSHGFVKVDPATMRLVFTDGTPARFFGVNFAQFLSEPDRKIPTEEMTKALDDLQQMGVNVIRFQTYDDRIQKGAFGTGINEVALENRDRFIAEAKKRGIYFHMSMNTSNEGKGASREMYEKMGGSKQSMILIDELVKDQETFACNLLNHVNPYTGLAYKDEPAIISIQLGNEQHAYSRAAWGGTWTKFKGAFADEIRAKWNHFLAEKYGTREKLAAAWGPLLKADEDPTKGTVAITDAIYPTWNNVFTPTVRQRDAVLFGDDIQDKFYKTMRDAIRNKAGDKNHMISDNGWVRGDNLIRATAQKDLDMMDVQHYWPHFDRRRLSAEETLNVSPIKTCGINILHSLLTAREVDGKKGAGFVTEYNSHKDNQRNFQLVPVHAAMASLTGIDGTTLWTYSDGATDMLFNKDHWFSLNRENADLVPQLMPFIVGAYLARAGLPEIIDEKTIMALAKWDDKNPQGLSVDYDASLKQAVSVKAFENAKEGILIDFPNDKMLINRDNVIFYTGTGPIKTDRFDYEPIKNDVPYFVAVFPVDGKKLSESGEWRVFVTLDGTMKLKRSDLTMWRAVSRGYTSVHGENPKGTLDSPNWEIRRPANCMYYDLKTPEFAKAQQKAMKGDVKPDTKNGIMD